MILILITAIIIIIIFFAYLPTFTSIVFLTSAIGYGIYLEPTPLVAFFLGIAFVILALYSMIFLIGTISNYKADNQEN